MNEHSWPSKGLRLDRTLVVLAAALAYGLCVLWLALGAGHDLNGIITFSTLQALLLIGCFQWWFFPMEGRYHDYLCPLTLISLWTFVFFGPGSVPAYVDRPIQLGLGNPGAVEYFPMVLAPVVAGIFLWDWSYRFVHDHAVPCSSSQPSRRVTFGPDIKILLLFWVVTSVVGYVYLASRYSQSGVGFVGAGIGSTRTQLDNPLDTALNQILWYVVFFAWTISVFVVLTARQKSWKTIGVLGAAVTGLLILSTLSRRRILIAGLTFLGLYLYQRRPSGKQLRTFTLKVGSVVLLVGLLVTGLKVVRGLGGEAGDNQGSSFGSIASSSRQIELEAPAFRDAAVVMIRYSVGYRLAGLDLLAGTYESRSESGTPLMEGHQNLLAASKALPQFLWPEGQPEDQPKELARKHFSLPDLDHLNTFVSAAYMDFGGLGVSVGFVLFAVLMALVEGLIWHQRLGVILYFGTLSFPADYETYMLLQPLLWLRFLLLVGILSFVVLATRRIFVARESNIKNR